MNSDLTCNIPEWEHFPWIVIIMLVGICLMIYLGTSNKHDHE